MTDWLPPMRLHRVKCCWWLLLVAINYYLHLPTTTTWHRPYTDSGACLPRWWWWCRLNYLDILIPPLCVCLPAYSPQKTHSCFVTSSLTTRWITKTFSPSIRYLRSFSVSQQQCRGLNPVTSTTVTQVVFRCFLTCITNTETHSYSSQRARKTIVNIPAYEKR